MNNIADRMGKFISDNSPTILTAVAASGVIATTVAAVRGTVTAVKLIEREKQIVLDESRDYDITLEEVHLSKQAIVQIVWKAYIPTALVAGTTVAAIIGGHTINKRRQAVLIGAYSLIDNAYKEFQEKARDQIGEKEYVKVVDSIAEDRIDALETTGEELKAMADGKVACYEVWSGRVFVSDMETIRKAVNDHMLRVINSGYASHNEFYDQLGLTYTEMGEQLGWTTENPMEAYYTSVLKDGVPTLAVTYRQPPISEYMRVF